MSDAPLVHLWHDHTRPLNWRPYLTLSATEQAQIRCLLIYELWLMDHSTALLAPWWWEHTHRELLEVKAASGHEPHDEEP